MRRCCHVERFLSRVDSAFDLGLGFSVYMAAEVGVGVVSKLVDLAAAPTAAVAVLSAGQTTP